MRSVSWRVSLAAFALALAACLGLLALIGNLITLALGCAIWFFFPILVA